MADSYNKELCNEKHSKLDKTLEKFGERLGKTENRFIVLLTGIILNLMTAGAALIVLLLKQNGIK